MIPLLLGDPTALTNLFAADDPTIPILLLLLPVGLLLLLLPPQPAADQTLG